MLMKRHNTGEDRKGKGRRIRRSHATVSTTIIYGLLAGCDAAGPGSPVPFAQSGEIHIAVETPLHLGLGWLRQEIEWASSGAWAVYEEIGYRDVVGEREGRRNPGLPLQFADNYSRVVQALDKDPNFRLADVPPLELAQCEGDHSKITLRIVDAPSRATRVWVRCASGTLATLVTAGSGPDVDAAKVVQFVQAVRTQTVGTGFRSAYVGSLPFGTVAKGTDTGWDEHATFVFRTPDGGDTKQTQAAWDEFWRAHNHGARTLPPGVDWETDMVLAGFLGVREEVGDSAEIRSVITIDAGTKVEWAERIPGDFCVPARRIVRPFHIVFAPRAPAPVEFSEVQLHPVACGT